MSENEGAVVSEQKGQVIAERRQVERRSVDLGPPLDTLGRRIYDRRDQGSTTAELLVEVGRFAAENVIFRQKGNIAAARRARKHLSNIMKLSKQRRAEISNDMKKVTQTSEDDETLE